MISLHLVTCLIYFVAASNAKLCRSQDRHPHEESRLSTKTPYAYIQNNSTEEIQVEGCVPVQFWMSARHGTRNPSKAAIKIITKRLPDLAKIISDENSERLDLCDKDVKALLRWKVEMDPSEEKKLHPEGELEHINLAGRFQFRFPNLLTSDYHEESFVFRATKAERAQRSQYHFAVGLFGRKEAKHVVYQKPILPHDPVIRFYKVCKAWQRDVKHNPESLAEQRKFSESKVMKNVVEEVSTRLGFTKALPFKDIEGMYIGCVFGQAWKPAVRSPWCNVFNDQELEVMEYYEDLEYFWQDGYGYPLNYRQACIHMQDLMQNFRNVSRGLSEKSGVFYFSHSGTMLKFFAYLGLFKDEVPLRHDNYEEMKNRRFRTSKMDAFASNVVFVLQKCQGGNQKVGMFVNEVLTVIPGCLELWCDYEAFENAFKESLDKCDFEKICDNSSVLDFDTEIDDKF